MDCNAFVSSDTENYNEECTNFKSLGFLNHSIVYELNLYNHLINSLDMDWMSVLYQYPLFFDTLINYSENNLISFEYSGLEFTHGSSGSVEIIYNDGKNQVMTKSFFVDIVDVTELDNDTIAVNSFFELDYNDTHLSFETFDNNYYKVSFKSDFDDIEYLEYIYRHAEYPFGSIDVNLTVSYLGYKVEVVTGETTTFYHVFHNDFFMDESNEFLNLSETHDSYLQIPIDSEFYYCLDYLELSRQDNVLRGKFIIYNDTEILFEEEFELEWDQVILCFSIMMAFTLICFDMSKRNS